jgi:hypothetical protein
MKVRNMMNIQSKLIGGVRLHAPKRQSPTGCVDKALVDQITLSGSGQGQNFQSCLDAPNVSNALRAIFQAPVELNEASVQEIAQEHLGQSWKGRLWTVDGKSVVGMSSNLQEIQIGLASGNIDLLTSLDHYGAQLIVGEVNPLGEFVAGSIQAGKVL